MNEQDVLSEVFATLRINGNLYFRAEFFGDYSVEVPRERRSIRFHLVRHGRCWLHVPGGEPVRMERGDICIIPNGAPQVLASDPALAPVGLGDVLAANPVENGRLRHGEGECGVSLLCGYCVFDEDVDHPVLAALPAHMLLRPRDLDAEPWTRAALDLLAMEAEQEAPGMTGVLSRMLEIVFIHSVRRMAGDQQGSGGRDGRDDRDVRQGGAGGFIAALGDVGVSRALHAIHAAPQEGWTVELLAGRVGMSRARFADVFVRKVGVPPMAYLTQWRLLKARTLLAGTNLNLEEIALRCGYASGASFSRRFKQEFDMGPGAYRKTSRALPV